MADIYDRAKASAARMLAPRAKGGKGAELVIRSITKGEYDPGTGQANDVVVESAGSGLRQNYKQSDIDGTLIKQGDVKIILSPVLLDGTDTPTPKSQDLIVFAGEQYTLQNVEPWDFAGLAVGFSVQARK